MSDGLATRFYLTLGGRDLELYPVDSSTFRVFIDGEISGPFTGYTAAHRNAVQRVDEDDTFSDAQRDVIARLSNWNTETVDTFDPEGN